MDTSKINFTNIFTRIYLKCIMGMGIMLLYLMYLQWKNVNYVWI